jgi:hypothetical protein
MDLPARAAQLSGRAHRPAPASTPPNSSGYGENFGPLATDTMPLEVPPPRSSRFGSPLVLSRVHWVRPELVSEIKFLTWTEDTIDDRPDLGRP